jgi:hypothetical protein
MTGLEIAQIFIKHIANAATKVLTFPPWENRPSSPHESSWKPIKTTSLKPGDEISLMRIFYLSGKIPENTIL